MISRPPCAWTLNQAGDAHCLTRSTSDLETASRAVSLDQRLRWWILRCRLRGLWIFLAMARLPECG